MRESLKRSRELGTNIRKILDPLDPQQEAKESWEVPEIEVVQEMIVSEDELPGSTPESLDLGSAKKQIEELEEMAKEDEKIEIKEERKPREDQTKSAKRKRFKRTFRAYQDDKDGIFED